jgi:hypothetical protein
MPILVKNVEISASSGVVFRYLNDPTHLTAYCPNILEVGPVKPNGVDGTKFTWVYKLLDVRFEGEAVLTNEKHNEHLNFRFWGGLRGDVNLRMTYTEEITHLEIVLDYMIPLPILKKHRSEAVLQQTKVSLEQMLKMLKTLMEAQNA